MAVPPPVDALSDDEQEVEPPPLPADARPAAQRSNRRKKRGALSDEDSPREAFQKIWKAARTRAYMKCNCKLSSCRVAFRQTAAIDQLASLVAHLKSSPKQAADEEVSCPTALLAPSKTRVLSYEVSSRGRIG